MLASRSMGTNGIARPADCGVLTPLLGDELLKPEGQGVTEAAGYSSGPTVDCLLVCMWIGAPGWPLAASAPAIQKVTRCQVRPRPMSAGDSSRRA